MSYKKCKIVIIGESQVGKTSVVDKFTRDTFNEQIQSTIGAAFNTKQILTSNQDKIELQIWDTAGQEKYRALTPLYFRDCKGAVIAYDITNRKSFEEVQQWVNMLEKHSGSDNTQKVIIGNKSDLNEKRVVEFNEGVELARFYNAGFFETSAKENQFIQEPFNYLADQISNGETKQPVRSEEIFKMAPSYKPQNTTSNNCYC